MSVKEEIDLGKIEVLCSALSNIHRLRILKKLSECCKPTANWDIDDQIPCCIGEVTKDLGIALSTASHHIKELARADLIKLDRNGQRVICSLNDEAISLLAEFFGDLKSE